MNKKILHVEGMSCEHCVKAVKNAAQALPGVASVRVDLAGKTAELEYDPAVCDLERVISEIEDQGYDVSADAEK